MDDWRDPRSEKNQTETSPNGPTEVAIVPMDRNPTLNVWPRTDEKRREEERDRVDLP